MNVYTLPNPRPLEIAIAKKWDKKFAQNTEWRQFTNGEWHLRVPHMLSEAIVLGRTEMPGDHIFQTLTLIDTLKRNSAQRITLILPYFGYSRHDRIVRTGDHLPADLLTKLFNRCGATRIVTVDLHSSITEKNSPLPISSIDFVPELVKAFKKVWRKKELLTIVSPDQGSKHRANAFRDLLDSSLPVCWLEKHRDPVTGKVHAHELFGVKRGTTALITDDILDTGSTIEECVRQLKIYGFKTFYLCVTHPIFSCTAVQTIRALKFKHIFVSNTVPLSHKTQMLPITIIDAFPALVATLRTFL